MLYAVSHVAKQHREENSDGHESHMMKANSQIHLVALLAALVYLPGRGWCQLPKAPTSFRFAVIGDTGTGGREQREVAELLDGLRQKLDFRTVLMLGDNIYGGQTPTDF